MENKNQCLIILGTPRSGNSVLAGCLKLLGADPGKNIIFPDKQNGDGRFENNDLILAHNILLRDLACKEDMIGGLPKGWQSSRAADNAKLKIRSILENNFSSDSMLLVKDPRICRFLPLWLSLLEEMEIKPGLILNLRHPLENARSFAANNNFNIRQAFLLWFSHYREAFSASYGISNTVITFDQLLADPVFTLKNISDNLDIEYPDSLESRYMDILNFVRPEMKHHHSGQSSKEEESQFDHFINLYEQVRLLCIKQTAQLTANTDKKEDVLKNKQNMLPNVLQHFSSENAISNIENSPREKASQVSNNLFNDILLLIGEHEREQHSQIIKRERILLSGTDLKSPLFAQVYFPQDQEKIFTEEKSQKILLAPAEWQEITIPLPDSTLIRSKGLRLKPLNIRGIVHISGIRLMNPATDNDVLKIETTEQFRLLKIEGDAFKLPGKDILSIFVYNFNPRIIIPPSPDLPDCPLEIRIWIKVQTNQEEMKTIWKQSQESLLNLRNTRAKIQEELELSRSDLESAQKAQNDLQSSKTKIEADLASIQNELETSSNELQSERKSREELNSSKTKLETDLTSIQNELETSSNELQSERKSREILNSSKTKLETDLTSIQNKLLSSSTELASERKSREELNSSKTKLEADLESIQNELETSSNELQSERKSREELETTKAILENDLISTQEVLEISFTDMDSLYKTREELESSKAGLESDLASVREALESSRNDLTSEQMSRKELESANASFESKLKKVEAQNSGVREDLSGTQSQLQQAQNQIHQLNTKNSELESANTSFESKLKEVEAQNSGVREDLSGTQSQLQQAKNQNHQLNTKNSELLNRQQKHLENIDQTNKWLSQLQNDFDGLLDSKRWKAGNFLIRMLEIILLRKKQPLAINHMQQIFDTFNSTGVQKQNVPSSRQAVEPGKKGFELTYPATEDSLMRQLENDLTQLSNSARWKVGHVVIRLVETMLFRGKTRLAMDHMQDIFKEYKSITSTWSNISPEMTQRWKRNLESDLQDLIASKRWKVGNGLIRLLEIILMRKKQPLAIDHMLALFKQYDQGLKDEEHNLWDEDPVQENYYQPEPVISQEMAPIVQTEISEPLPQQVNSSPELNVLLVSHSRINSNSGYHVKHYAEMLNQQEVSCIVAVPEMENGDNPQDKPYQVYTYDECGNTLPFPNKKGPDIVHAWTPREHVRKFCQDLEKSYSFKTIIHLEDNEEYLTENTLSKPYNELKKLSLSKLDSLIPDNRFHPVRGWKWLKKADGLTLIIETLQRFNPNGLPSTILPAPVDERLFYPRPINHKLRKRLNIPTDHIVLCYTGDVRTPKKQGVLELYKAVEQLNQQGYPATLIRTGTNFVPLDLDESRYQDFEKKLGWVSRHEVADIMAAADILIQPGWPGPFDDERLPAKLPEYFAMGRPVILPKTNLGLKVKHLKDGYILDKADGKNIADAVIEIYKSNSLPGILATGGLEFYKCCLTPYKTKQLLKNFYLSLN